MYNIKSTLLKPWIQYILFNFCTDKHYSGTIRSFANTNFCLGITRNKRLLKAENDLMLLKECPGINSYLTGIYLDPLDVLVKGIHDEICIDFTPQGFYHFFKFPGRTFMLNDDILNEAFGKGSLVFFERAFMENDLEKRGLLIEDFLKKQIIHFTYNPLYEAASAIHRLEGNITVAGLSKIVKCSEKKVYRIFTSHFDLTPKQYIRVVRFRKSLALLSNNKTKLVSHAYEAGFSDQCHFIKELKFFTGFTPKKGLNQIQNIHDRVLVSIL